MEKTKHIYNRPEIEVAEITVEHGIAISGGTKGLRTPGFTESEETDW